MPRPHHMATGARETKEMLVTEAVTVEEPDQVKVVQTGPITPEDKNHHQTQLGHPPVFQD